MENETINTEQQPELSLEQKIEERIKGKQATKDFKDTSVITYSRKYQAAYDIITMGDLEEIEKDKVTAYKSINKDKVFPKFDIEQLKAEGKTSGYCYFLTKTREALSSKPIDSPEARKLYVMACEVYREGVKATSTVDELRSYNESFLRRMGLEITKQLYKPKYSWMSSRGNSIDKDTVASVLGITFYNFCLMYNDASKTKYVEAIMYNEYTHEQRQEKVNERKNELTEKAQKFEQWIKQVEDAQTVDEIKTILRGTSLLRVNVPEQATLKTAKDYANEALNNILLQYKLAILDVEKKISKLFTVRAESWEWHTGVKERKSRDEKELPFKSILEQYGITISGKVKPLAHIKRENGLQVTDISVKSIVENFGYKDVVYGNYMDNKSSEVHTKYFLKAMLDMAEALDFDIKAVNKLGGLSILFGVTGCGLFSAAAACYMKQRKAINLTKKNGDGAIAHEWGHYLDNMLSEGNEIRATGNTYASEVDKYYNDSFKLRKAFQNWRNYTLNGEGTVIIQKQEFGANAEKRYYLHGDTIEKCIEEVQRRYKDYKDYYKAMTTPDIYQYYGYIAHKFGVNSIVVELEVKSSNFYFASHNVGVYMMNVKYWTSIVEMFARGFEAYVSEKLKLKGIYNNYLVDYEHNFNDNNNYNEWIPYPQGEEMKKYMLLYDEIIKALKEEFNISGFSWITNERENYYLEQDNSAWELKQAGIKEKVKNGEVVSSETVEEDEKPQLPLTETEKLQSRIELLKEMAEDEKDKNKKQVFLDRIELLTEMIAEKETQEAEVKRIEEEKLKSEIRAIEEKQREIEEAKARILADAIQQTENKMIQLKAECPYPTIDAEDSLEQYKRSIVATLVREDTKIYIHLTYFDGAFVFQRTARDWSEIITSFERNWREKRFKRDNKHEMVMLMYKRKKGQNYLVYFEPKQTVKTDVVKDADKKDYKKPIAESTVLQTSGEIEYEVIKSKHTQTGADIWILKLKTKVTDEKYREISNKLKRLGGYYSKFVKGFVFKSEPKELSI